LGSGQRHQPLLFSVSRWTLIGPRLLLLGPSSCPYSPEFVELEFSEVHIQDPA